MNNTEFTPLPGSGIYEYLVVLNPHEELRNKIIQVRQQLYDKLKVNAALFGRPQVTLVKFAQREGFEERISNRLQAIAMGFHPVKVELRNFGSFPSHTIFINVISKLPVQELTKQIRSEAQILMKTDPQHKPLFFLEPYIPVAQKLIPWQYEQSWLEYQSKDFTGRFIADAMLLLKRIKGEGKYMVAGRYEFQNLLVSTKQGELFN